MKQYIVDAFTDRLFHGNQAAVCIMESWPDETQMMAITRENNFSETAFAVRDRDRYHLRWFTPGGEIDLCGHATLATAYVLFRFYEPDASRIAFHTQSGDLFVHRSEDLLVMDFPAYHLNPAIVTDAMEDALGIRPLEAWLDRDLLLVLESEDAVRSLRPDLNQLIRLPGVLTIATARGQDYDCVSRVFAPKLNVEEDPVTGSAHCMITPYWENKLQKTGIHAFQASARSGELYCRTIGDRVEISGKAVLFSVADLKI